MPPSGATYHGLALLVLVSLMIISTRQSINTVDSSLGNFDISPFGDDITEWVNEAGDDGGGDDGGAVEIPSHRSIGISASTIQAVALLRGLKTFGVVRLTQIGFGPTQISGFVKGLFPFGKHGFHVHQHRVVGLDCESAGEHYNPTHQTHGPKDSPKSHIGDLGNLQADATGAAKFDVSSTRISLRGKFSVLERSLVIHLQRDDLGTGYNRESLQSGNSGARIACEDTPARHILKLEVFLRKKMTSLRPISLDEVCADGSPPPPLQLHDKVVWISDTGPEYGIVKWLGKLPDVGSEWMAGVSFLNPVGSGTGLYNEYKLFETEMNHASLVPIVGLMKATDYFGSTARIDESFPPQKPRRSKQKSVDTYKFYTDNKESSSSSSMLSTNDFFGSIDCPTVLGDVAHLGTQEDLAQLCGKNRGIQGHHNSCYLDATLFAMFSSTTVFESLLYRPKRADDIPEYNEVQRILKEEIVNPLRANYYVRADQVMHLRQLLERISSMRGLTSEEKDPEEFLNLLLNQILKTDPYLKLSSGLTSSLYQLFVEKDENLQLPNVQQLFDQSFLTSDIKLREIPLCLIIQMPRFGAQFKMYPRIMPSLYLDITNVLENSPRQCIVCGELAEFECKECFGKFGEGLESIAFCAVCIEKSHSHKKRSKHKTTKLAIPAEFAMLKNHTNIPQVTMELFAVLCIETSHYVSFVKCGSGPDSPWCFFDSMADRKGEQNGYNIPEVIAFPDLKWWLSEDGYNFLLNNKDDKMIPELPRRLLSDAYICFYSSEVLRYR